jgi:hypothetical protein
MAAVNKLPISVCFIAGAEAGRIGNALASVVEWTTEIIVVLNEDVSDGTDTVSSRFGARVYREPWKGHIDQKNSAAAKASCAWILGLDSDEVVSPELRDEIERVLSDPDRAKGFAAFSFPRCSRFCGRWIRHGDWYPDRNVRLWRRGQAKWGGVNPHDRLMVEGKIARLKSDLLHYTADSIDKLVLKLPPYSTDFVKQRLQKDKTVRSFELPVRPIWRFVRGYFLKLGFLDGWQGYYIAWYNAFSALTRYAKLREAELGDSERQESA